MMPTPDVDVAAILDALANHDVEYVVIGGFAAELHDVALPPTQDIDITPAAFPENLVHLVAALNQLGAKLRVPDDPAGFALPDGATVELLSTMQVLTLVTTAGPLDISMTPQGTAGYEDLHRAQVSIAYGDRVVPVAALEDVIRSKEAAGREKDLKVLPALQAHQDAKRRREGWSG
jgi:hypothetical protein